MKQTSCNVADDPEPLHPRIVNEVHQSKDAAGGPIIHAMTGWNNFVVQNPPPPLWRA